VSEHFTLASWNIFQGLHYTSRRDNWVPNELAKQHLADLEADVLVLPEMWAWGRPKATWAEDVAASLGYELHQWRADRPSRAREVVPFRMVIMTRIPARRLDDRAFSRFGSYGQRAMVRIELEDSGLRIAGGHLMGIHLLPRHPRDFRRELAELSEVAAQADVVAGDMNMWGPVVSRAARPLRQAVKGRTYPASRPHSQIDHIFVSERVEVLSSEVLPETGSDHRAIRATLRPAT